VLALQQQLAHLHVLPLQGLPLPLLLQLLLLPYLCQLERHRLLARVLV
jgi:hypothetical protein